MQDASAVTDVGKVVERRSGHPSVVPKKPKLLDRLRRELRSRHYSLRTEQTYVNVGQAVHLFP